MLGNEFFVAVGCDETDDPRSRNEYILTVEIMLIPKQLVDVSNIKTFHLGLQYPEAVNGSTVALAIDRALREFLIRPEDVHYFVHDSAPYMASAAGKLQTELGYRSLVHVPC